MAATVTRRKLIWGEIQRLQREQGGIPEVTQTFDKKGSLTKTVVRKKDASRALLAAEARLAELDRFCAALDSGRGALPGVRHHESARFRTSSNERATTYSAAGSLTRKAPKWALPQAIFAPSRSRRSSVNSPPLVSTTK